MYGSSKVIPSLILFVALVTLPFWYNAGKAQAVPKPELPKDQKFCVEPMEQMRTNHMQILNEWRNDVVRDADRVWVTEDGKKFTMSLSNGCLRCHTDKAKFCDKCHDYLGVKPFCWDCHLSDQYGKGGK